MRRTTELARDTGTSLVFLSANTLYWQVELSPSPSGVPHRLMTCRKRQGPGRPVLWREIDRPEQELIGIQYTGHVPEPHPLIVRNADHWLWEATGAQEGDELTGMVAGEADRYFPRTPLPEHEERIPRLEQELAALDEDTPPGRPRPDDALGSSDHRRNEGPTETPGEPGTSGRPDA